MAGNKLSVGNVDVVTLTDAEGRFPFTLDQIFPAVSLDRWAPYQERYPGAFEGKDAWHVHYGGSLVRSGGQTILVDTGIGPRRIPLLGGFEGKLLEDLKAHGVSPEDIDIVFMTHAHIDHIGWNLTTELRPSFPRARYVLHRTDWVAMRDLEQVILQFGGPTYVDETLAPLEALGVLDLLDGESTIAEGVTAIPTPGHTPGSMSVLISSGGEKAIIPGDVMVTPAQVSEPDWVFGFDTDAQTAITSRIALLDRMEAEGMTLATCHFPHPGFGRIVRVEGRRYWQAL